MTSDDANPTLKKVRNIFCNHTATLEAEELEILFTIASKKSDEILTKREIAKRINRKYTTTVYRIAKYEGRGLITDDLELTDKSKRQLQYLMGWDESLVRKLRAHNIQIVVYLAKSPLDLGSVKNSIFKSISNKRYRGLKVQLNGCQVLIYSSKKAVVVLPDVYGNDDEEIAAAINHVVKDLIVALELEFEGLKVDSYKVAKFSCMHVAVLDSVIAEQFILEKGHIQSNGRIAVDKSHGRYELEAERVDTALEDVEVLVKYEDLAAENVRLKAKLAELESRLNNSCKPEVVVE